MEDKSLAAIRGALAIYNFPQWKAAQMIGTSEGNLSKMLLGRKPMPDEIKKRLVVLLGIERAIASIGVKIEV